MSKPDVIIGTCIYNRTWTIPNFIKSLHESTKHLNYRLELVLNFDEMWPREVGFPQVNEQLSKITEEERNHIGIWSLDNEGLQGFNVVLKRGAIHDVPVLLCNDDVLIPEGWTEYLMKEDITTVMREGKEVEIDPNSIGCIGPCYVEPGSMQHQKMDMDKHGYTNVDFVVGHAQLITRNAIRKGFTFDPNICTIFGPFDVYQSMKLLSLDMNILVSQDCCFDFPESKESHFHNGDHQKFASKFTPIWQKMQENINAFQKEHIAKHGYNKWYF